MDQLTTVVDGLGHTVFNAGATGSYDANGNLMLSSDGLAIQHRLGCDALNRPVQTVDNYNGTDTATRNTTTGYTYDGLDRLTQVTDPTGQVSPDSGTTSRTFDAAGNVLTRTDAKGITATNTYDALDRLILGISGGNWKKGATLGHALRHTRTAARDFSPQPASKVSGSRAASSIAAVV